ncbi:phage tail protein, partial [Bacillus sp. XF8]|uniref:phage tail protein n=1 Tax=Bacillus sp. XF8 TaxID=2819289 RepID=UPI001FB85B5F
QTAKLIREYTSPLASIPGIGKRHAPPLKDGRIKLTTTMDSKLKTLVDESLNISVTANIHDLSKQKYPIAQSGLGDRVFLIDERIGLNAEVRVVNRYVLRDWRGNILDIQLTFGSQDITKRYQANLNHATKTINDLMEGREKLPINAMTAEVANVTNMILGVTSEIDITEKGLIAIDKSNPNYVVVLNSAGLGVSSDGGTTFRNAITGRGIVAERILAGEIKGSTLRTDSGANYVHIEKQFIRLMESNLTRMYFGYYINISGRLQPTILMHENITTDKFQEGTLVIAQQNLGNDYSANFGVAKGESTAGTTYYPSNLRLTSSGNAYLIGDNFTSITGKKGVVVESTEANCWFESQTSMTLRSNAGNINQYAPSGGYWVEVANGVTFKVSNPSNSFYVEAPKATFKCQVSTDGVNVAGGSPDSIGTIKYMNGFKGWGYYGHIGSSGWANFTITV